MKKGKPSMKKYDFVVPINIPGDFVTPKQIEQIYPHLEENLKHLVQVGYMTNEEAVAYAKFATDFASMVPFVMEEFLKFYRNAVANATASTTAIQG